MCKQLCIMVLSFILLLPTVGNATIATTYPNRPSLPKEDENEILHEIIITDKENFQEILRLTKEKYPSLQINHVFKNVFSGFSVKGKQSELLQLKKEPGVEHSSPVTTYRVSLEKSVPFIGGDAVRGHFDKNDHRLTGKGVKVGVIDTGVDYTHPDLRRNFKGGYDLVDGDRDPMETKGIAGKATLHGTHVAGIIAANGKVKGVAPEADIIGYRALGPGGMGTSEQVIAAIDRAIEDGVDVINLSLGNTINGPDWPTSLALDKATEKGIVAVTSSGNSGPKVWTVGSPGTSSKAISVGASTPPLKLPYVTIGLEDKQIHLQPLQGSIPWRLTKEFRITDGGLGRENEVKDVNNKIALIERGTLSFTEKAMNAQKRGAKAVIIFNNEAGNFEGSLETELEIPVASISQRDGQWLKRKMEQHQAIIKTSYHIQKDTIAQFSSRGPVTETWEIKPDVVAPGVAIESTIPDGYMELQGTSMAAPHVAGASALLIQEHPDWSPEQIKAALMNTALLLVNEEGNIYKPYEQGAGRIQLHEAIHAETLIYPSSLAFGMLHHHDQRKERKITITIENQSSDSKYYSFEIPKRKNGIQWKLPVPFYLKPHEKKEVTVTLDIYPSIIPAGLHNGYLFVNEGENRIHLPYMYAIEEPNYPRIMGFQFGKSDKEDMYHYELYLPGGADEYGIALYEPDTLRFVTFLDWAKDVPRGLVEREINCKEKKLEGVYKAIIFAKKAGREDTIEAEINVDHAVTGRH